MIMERESLVFIRTMHDVKTAREIWRRSDSIKTSSSIFRAWDIKPAIDERALAILLEQERQRFARQTQSIERSKKKVEHARAKLLATIEKNRRLMELRWQLQRERWAQGRPNPSPHPCLAGRQARSKGNAPGDKGKRVRGFNHVMIKYGGIKHV